MSNPDHATLQQAAQWYARLSASPGDAQTRSAWQHWHDQDEAHRQAWHYVERISQRFEPLQQDGDTAMQTLAAARRTDRSRRQVLRTLAILSGGALLGWAGLNGSRLPQPLLAWRADYRSATGEIRDFTLTDGTRFWLNSASALDVDYQPDARRLRLLEGEVLIDTAKDSRPFFVETRDGRLRALGTRFSVLQQEQGSLLSVFDGVVEVINAEGGERHVLEAGEQVHFDRHRISGSTPAMTIRQDWQHGRLLANDLPLSSVIDELSRYRHGHLGIDPRVADLRVMGTYPLHDIDLALAMLESVLPVRIHHTLPWWTTVEPRP